MVSYQFPFLSSPSYIPPIFKDCNGCNGGAVEGGLGLWVACLFFRSVIWADLARCCLVRLPVSEDLESEFRPFLRSNSNADMSEMWEKDEMMTLFDQLRTSRFGFRQRSYFSDWVCVSACHRCAPCFCRPVNICRSFIQQRTLSKMSRIDDNLVTEVAV